MKKILVSIAGMMSAIYAWWIGVTLQDVIDVIDALVSAFMDYVMPRQQGIKSYIVSGYLGTRAFFGRMLGWQPLTTYDHILNRAQANPLEAFGAVSLIFCFIWLIIFKYRMLYRFYHWLLVTRHKR